MSDNPWRETVRALFDELHFGQDNLFTGNPLAKRLAGFIERQHPEFFTAPAGPMSNEEWAKAIIIHLTGRPDEPTPMLLKMIDDIRNEPKGLTPVSNPPARASSIVVSGRSR